MRRFAWLFMALASLPFAGAAGADELTLLDGRKVEAQIAGIDAAGKLSGTGIPDDLELDALRRIDRTADASPAAGRIAIDLIGGGRVGGASVTVESEKFHVTWSLAEKLVLPIDVVRAVRFKPSTHDGTFEAALAKPLADNDRLFVEVDGKLTILTGLVETLTADNVVFQYEGQQQTLPTAKLFGIVVAQVARPANANKGATVELTEGSRIAGAVKSLAGGQLTISVGPAEIGVPWNAVKSVTVRSSRLAFLSDLEPTEIEEYRLVTLPQAWQRDKSVAKKPLAIGERKFDRGIGAHAYSKLVFEIGGAYDVLSTVIGIDAAAERKGDCVFVVLGDGKELARQRMTGASEPKELQLDIAGVRELTLIVEPGEDLDLADLADWADARLIKQK